MKGFFLVIISLIFSIVYVSAQDVHFSQQFDNDIYLNPAQSGLGNKANRLVFQYRDQWRSVPVPFSSTFLSYDRKINVGANQLIGAGLQFLYDRAGDGQLSTIKVSVSPAYTRFFKEERFGLSIGFQIGMLHRFVDADGLVFESQFDGTSTDNPSGEVLGGNATAPDLGFGIHFSSKIGDKKHKVETGFSMYNFHEPNLAFVENAIDNRPSRYNVYAKSEIFLGNKGWSINPVIEFQRQEKLNNILPIIYAKKYLQNGKRMAFSFGGGYRVGDAAQIYVAYEVKDFKIGLDYDWNTSGFNDATNSVGAGEILVKYEFERKKKEEPIEFVLDTLIVEDTTEIAEEEEEVVEEETVTIEEVDVKEPIETEVIKPVEPIRVPKISMVDQINSGTGIRLYFPNDYPDPKSTSPTTNTPYGEIYRKYMNLSLDYFINGGDEGNMYDFIDNHVVKEWKKYTQLIREVDRLLLQGKKVTLVIKGHTSPLANSDYNLNLSKRRVHSFIKQISSREDLDRYFTSGQLQIKEVFFGESKSNTEVSDDRKDTKNSIYSDKAAFERRVEIEQVIVK